MAQNLRLPPVTTETPHRNPKGFKPRFTDSQVIQDRIRRIERLDQDLHHYEATSETSHRLLRRALARNAFGTASIEGNPLTQEQVESLLEAAPGALDAEPDEREILNWSAFMEVLGDPFPAALDGIRRLHGQLFSGVMPDAGRWKTRQNYIGNRQRIIFIPAAPKNVAEDLRTATKWLAESKLAPVVRAALFFHEFEAIHPFRDGNGRVGRALFTWYLHAAGYRGIRYALVDYAFNQGREPYYANLALVERNGYDYTPWVEYMLEVLETTYADAVRRFALAEAHPELSERQQALLGWFVRLQSWNKQRRVKFADVHAAFPHVLPRTLQRDLAALARIEVIAREGQRKATVYWLPKARMR